MKTTLRIKLEKRDDRSYPIIIGTGLFPAIAEDLSRKPLGYGYIIISDSTVMRLYGGRLLSLMRGRGLNAHALSFPAGERSKSRRVKAGIEDRMLRLGMGRDSCIIALGGGVTGDLAGYVAATYNRGIPYIQVPTTLLAMVDSSVGGKTGIDVPAGKNLVGAFHQPRRVYIGIDALDTLPQKQYLSGLAEAVKTAIIKSAGFFNFIEDERKAVLERDVKAVAGLVKTCCSIKAGVVEADEQESDLRRILNYGHTAGHALEAAASYRLLHGFAVSLGMAVEGRLAKELGFFPGEDLKRQNLLLKRLGLPVSLKNFRPRTKPEKLVEIMKSDKKAKRGEIVFALPSGIGRMKRLDKQTGIPVSEEMIKKVLLRLAG